MKNQVMVLGKIAIEAVKLGARSLVKYTGKEKKFWSTRYGSTGGRAVRHGLAVGPGIGSLLSNDNGIEPDGKVSKPRYGAQTGKPDKARSGYKRYSSRRRRVHVQYCNCKRQSNSNKYFRR